MKILSIFVLTADQKFSIIELIKIHQEETEYAKRCKKIHSR